MWRPNDGRGPGPGRVEYRLYRGSPYGIPGVRDYYSGSSGPRGMKFSRTEIRQLLHATLALTVAFTFVLTEPFFNDNLTMEEIGMFMGISLLVVGTGFVLHEMGHKYYAQKFGCWSEFRASYGMLFFSILISMFGFLIAAPGAVMIHGPITRRENGIISLAGPATNIVIAAVALPLYAIFTLPNLGSMPGWDPGAEATGGAVLGVAFFLVFWLNIVLAGFNLLPIGNFDGRKILNWRGDIYVGAWTALVFVAMMAARMPMLI